jgi:putative transposase
MKCLQERVSKKLNGSKNRDEARHNLSKIHETIGNQRDNFQHQLSFRLVRRTKQ